MSVTQYVNWSAQFSVSCEPRPISDTSARPSAGRDPASVTFVAVTKAQACRICPCRRHGGRHGFRGKLSAGGIGKDRRCARTAAALALHRREFRRTRPAPIAERSPGCTASTAWAWPGACPSSGPFTRRPSICASRLRWCRSRTRGHRSRGRCRRSRPRIAELPRVRLRGLMCVPPPQPQVTAERAVFARLRRLLEGLDGRRPAARYTIDGHER